MLNLFLFFTAFAALELVLGSEDRTYEAVKFGMLRGFFCDKNYIFSKTV